MNSLLTSLLGILVLAVFSSYFTKDDISCNLTGAEQKDVNGYYAAYGGMYFKRGVDLSFNPDIFGILELRRTAPHKISTISFSKHSWTIDTNMKRNQVYFNEPLHPEEYIYSPPNDNWKHSQNDHGPSSLKISGCRGSLQDSPPIPSHSQKSNIGELMSIPVTTSLLALIFYIAYYLWAYKVDVADVAYSYDAVVNHNQYFKIVTSTLSHYELWHLGFNSMSLYQSGLMLEGTQYSIVSFLYLNVALIFVTMLIETAVLYILKTYHNTDHTMQMSVGYSGVLFAWMVAVSVRLPKFCPIFILPSLCMTTYHLVIPQFLSGMFTDAVLSIPINIGPFVLLLFTKIIIPNSSFIGHLSGIIIGYPLAWNLLNWLTPPILVNMLVVTYILKEQVFMSSHNRDASDNLSEFVPIPVVNRYSLLCNVAYVLIALECTSVWFYGYLQILVRSVAVYLLAASLHARKQEFYCSLTSVHDIAAKLLGLTLVTVFCLLCYDICTLSATLSAYDLIIGCAISPHYAYYNVMFTATLIVFELLAMVVVLLNMYDMKAAVPVLSKLRADRASIEKDLERLGVLWLLRGQTVAFSGQGNRLASAGSTSPTSQIVSISNTNSISNSFASRDGLASAVMTPMNISTSVSGSGGGHGGNNSHSSSSSVNNTMRGVYTNPNRYNTSSSSSSIGADGKKASGLVGGRDASPKVMRINKENRKEKKEEEEGTRGSTYLV